MLCCMIRQLMLDGGLCSRCMYSKVVVSDRGAEFVRCLKPELPKYPRLPVVSCRGFARRD